MALVLGVKIGDIVDIADYWIKILSVQGRRKATIATSSGDTIILHSNYEAERSAGVWICLGPTPSQLQLQIEAPRSIPITLRRD